MYIGPCLHISYLIEKGAGSAAGAAGAFFNEHVVLDTRSFLLLAAHCLLITVCCSLLTVYWLLITGCCSMLTVYWLLFADCCLLLTTYGLLLAAAVSSVLLAAARPLRASSPTSAFAPIAQRLLHRISAPHPPS